jgi:CRP/FNR family transcriptional regulator/CRP/FNR family cyclic AMP-dependent transcriptional regulator
MDLIEKTFLLREVALLRDAESSSLARLASITEVVEVGPDAVLSRGDEPAAAFFVVVRGEVEVVPPDGERRSAGEGEWFGTRALLERETPALEVRSSRPSRLLRIARSDFDDLLLESPEVAVGILKGLARRFRTAMIQ